MIWRLLLDGAGEPEWNMAVDEALLVGEGAVLRLYGWSRPTFSWGRFQPLEMTTDPRALGYGAVRRPSGGRLVLHADEVTYALALPASEMSGTVLRSAAAIGEALRRGLTGLGIAVELAGRGASGERSGACFDAPSWSEVTSQGRKLVGSAQVRRGGRLLQHGSIPLRFPYRDLAGFLAGAEERAAALEKRLRRKAIGLEEAAGRAVSAGEVRQALIRGFVEHFGISLARGEFTAAEAGLAAKLAERYRILERSGGEEPSGPGAEGHWNG